MHLLELFTANLLPVFLAAGTGYVLAATLKPDPRSLSHAAFYVFAPCLMYQIITDNRLSATVLLRLVGFALTVLLAGAALAALLSRWAGWPRPQASAFVLVVLLPNAGNFGLSANALAFGQEGLTYASLFFVTSAVLTFSVGVLVASVGRASVRTAFGGLWRVPALWAVLLALVTVRAGWKLPSPVASTVHTLSLACVPVFLVILGIQLHVSRARVAARPVVSAVCLRLLGGPLLALALAPLFGLEGTMRQSAVLQAAMPSAVISTILAAEFDVEPGFVTAVVFFSTLVSPLTLTPLLALLGAGNIPEVTIP